MYLAVSIALCRPATFVSVFLCCRCFTEIPLSCERGNIIVLFWCTIIICDARMWQRVILKLNSRTRRSHIARLTHWLRRYPSATMAPSALSASVVHRRRRSSNGGNSDVIGTLWRRYCYDSVTDVVAQLVKILCTFYSTRQSVAFTSYMQKI